MELTQENNILLVAITGIYFRNRRVSAARKLGRLNGGCVKLERGPSLSRSSFRSENSPHGHLLFAMRINFHYFLFFLCLENRTFPSSEMREMVEGLKNRMNSLVLELKEKHHRQKQDLLALKKNVHKGRCKQIENELEFSRQCRQDSLDNNDVSTEIVLRKTICENDMNKGRKMHVKLPWLKCLT